MKKFIAIYHSSPEATTQMTTATPEQLEEGMKYWMMWKDKIGDAMVDLGAPLNGGLQIKPDGNQTASTKQVTGYSIVQAENFDEALKLFDNHPHLSYHSSASIELHETVAM